MTYLTILTTIMENGRHKRLTKVFSRSASGDIIKSDYDQAYLYDADKIAVSSIYELSEVLTGLEQMPWTCAIRGEPISETRSIRRALMDDPKKGPKTIQPVASGISWIMLDFDKLPIAALNLTTERQRLDYLVSLLPAEFQNTTYHYQWSSSAGMDGWQTASAHLWFWMAEPWACRDLYERFADGDYKDCEVDPAPFTSNQPHYTANPIFDGVQDPVAARSGLIVQESHAVTVSPWLRTVEAPQAISNRDHYASFGLSRFDDLLADIGPHFHRPILRAAAHYYATVPADEIDRNYLVDRLHHAILEAVPGRSRKADYLDRHYLDRVIDGAARKFGGAR